MNKVGGYKINMSKSVTFLYTNNEPPEKGRRDGELLFNVYRVSIWEDEKVLGMDSGDGCTATQIGEM